MPPRAVWRIVMCVRNQVRLMLLAAAGCRLGARVPAGAGKLAGVARGSDGWSHRSRGRRRGLHAGGVQARPVVDHRPHGVRRRWRDPWPGGLDVLPLSLTNETVVTITELTLALLLFSDASTVRLGDVEGDAGLPRRLLFI